MKQLLATNEANFATDVLNNSKPVLVDFWADWCGPCKAIAPVLDELATEYPQTLEIKKVNVDENLELTQQYGIRSIPTLMLFKDGEVKEVLTGVQPKLALNHVINMYQ